MKCSEKDSFVDTISYEDLVLKCANNAARRMLNELLGMEGYSLEITCKESQFGAPSKGDDT